MRPRSSAPWIFCFTFILVMMWAVYTRHAWEDYFITYRASKNLATGHGLTFTAGERVHSFTSPLGVLLPAAASLLTGNSSDEIALWIFRCMGAAALAGSLVILQSSFRRIAGANLAASSLLAALILSDAKILDFTINGMETPFLLLFLAWTWWALLTTPDRQCLHLGLSWAALMWTRPDAFVYIGGLSFGVLAFRPTVSSWREKLGWLRMYFCAGLLTVVLYLPWLAWAWCYYGTPIPHTITAKGLFLPKASPGLLLEWIKMLPSRIFTDHSILAGTFMPAYSFNTGWPAAAIQASFWLALITVLLWIIPQIRWEARVASFAAAVGQFYLHSFVGFATPWYLPPVTLLAFVTLSLLWGQWWTTTVEDKTLPGWNWRRPWIKACAVLLVMGTASLAVSAAYQLRWQQKIIEQGQRRTIGLWLREQAATTHDTVFLEPLGYIGFYSNLKMFDYPGLSSLEMVAARRRASSHSYPFCWPELITDLQPDWLVLRADEAKAIRERSPEIFTDFYEATRVFDVRAQVKAIGFLPGRRYLEGDAYFETYHRRAGLPKGVDLKLIGAATLTRRDSWGQPAYDSGRNLVTHAPAHVEFLKPAGARWLSGSFGFFEGAYTNPASATDGAIFTINFVGPDNVSQLLLERAMYPANTLTDQGLQPFRVELPIDSSGRIELLVSPGPAKNNTFDWTYWSGLMLESPRSY